ncbi:MAG: nucleoside-diphosphate kinase [Alphaproteobacteria bacterium]|nr:nucleoside-diphosphate kinase [Alphaproteobacteria bacterium]
MEYTLSIIKPDATARNLTGDINKFFTDKGLKVVAQKELTLSEEQAKNFYLEHKERPFYDGLVSYMTSGPVVVQVLAGENAIAKNREIMGATNPENAEAGTIRKEFAESLERNSVHGSDSETSAKREIEFFFDYNEITNKK